MAARRVLLGLGGNLGDRHAALTRAVDAMAEFLCVEATSPIYETAPQYVTDQPRFLNMALAGRTGLAPLPLLRALKSIEVRHGRQTRRRNGPREIDLDILAYGDVVASMDDLSLPHPRLTERAFVLAPLADIAAGWRHPVSGQTIGTLLAALPDRGQAVRVDEAHPPARRAG